MADPNVQYQLVTGSWAHVAEDGILDEDAYPDLVRPSGAVRFEPYLGSNEVVAAGSGFACTVGIVRAIVADGVLKDVQGRIGVWLAAYIDGSPVWWSAHYEDLNWNGVPVPSRDVVFSPSLAGVNITSLTNAGDIDPGDIPAYQSAQQSAAQAAASALEAKGYRDQAQTVVAGIGADRDAAAASAQAAANSATAAAGSASNASGSATSANTSKNAAAGSATAAANSATEAKGYRDQAADIVAAGVADGAVTTAKLADGAVTSAKIVDGTIVAADLANDSVNAAKIVDGSVGAAELASNAVTTVKIADNNVTTAKVADSAITSAKIADGTIVTADLADSSVTSAKIVDGTITNADISATAGIQLSKLETGRVRGQNNGAAVNLAVDYLTQAQYDAIVTKDANTVYLI